MSKNYVLDTNVLIHDPQSIFQFKDNNLYIPIYVLEELDKLKNEQTLRGSNSREACRILDDLRCQGSLSRGVKLENEGILFVYVPKERKYLDVALDKSSMDNAIMQSAIEIKEKHSERTILVTMDVNLRIRAESIDLQTAAYESQPIDINNLNNKVVSIEVQKEELDNFYRNGIHRVENSININTSVILKSDKSTGIARIKKIEDGLVAKKIDIPDRIMGLKPKNVEQKFALDILLDNEIKFVTLMGTAGSGKTILALASALHLILDIGFYDKLLVSRPVIPMGKDIGFLPGNADEKLRPFMQPIYDNVDFLLMNGGSKKKYGQRCDQLFENNIIEIEPLVYIRGRSIINQIMIVDECQSLSQHEIKTIISRCGENTKLIFTGDIDQIDNPYLTKDSNGLSAAVSKITNRPIVAHLMLEKGERSELANLAVERL